MAIKQPYGKSGPYQKIEDSYGLNDLNSDEIRDEWFRYEKANSEWRVQISDDESFYLGNQLTEKQKEYLLRNKIDVEVTA